MSVIEKPIVKTKRPAPRFSIAPGELEIIAPLSAAAVLAAALLHWLGA